MPNRIIKESVNESRGLTACSFFAQDLYKRLITYADDYGRFNADPQIMLARLYPRELADVSEYDLIQALIELDGVGKIGFYTSCERSKQVFGAFPNWADHQRVRDSKHKFPDPTGSDVNDWYYRRFIPIDMKVAIIERDDFKCAICGKRIADGIDAHKLIKMGTGTFHFDHIVPCSQGGRATFENLRLTCAKCNLSRKRSFTFDEILQFAETGNESPEISASSGELPPNTIQSNTIRIQSESESNPKSRRTSSPETDELFDAFWKEYPKKVKKPDAIKAWNKISSQTDPHDVIEGVARWKKSDQWTRDGGRFIPNPATWLNARQWEDEVQESNNAPKTDARSIQGYAQRDYSDEQTKAMERMMSDEEW